MVASISTKPNELLIAPLRTVRRHSRSSGYRGVYFHTKNADGIDVYAAHIKRAGRLHRIPGSDSTQPHICALYVARWYESEFGPQWRDALRSRWGRRPWHIRKSKWLGGYVATVWVLGEPERVVKLRKCKRNTWRLTERTAVFATAEEARRGMRLYLRRRFGLLEECVLYRGTEANVSPKVQQLSLAA
jgi:hypothetical protein